jgi:uncharacterized SAM-binding protein YcdF (DUF218 family)
MFINILKDYFRLAAPIWIQCALAIGVLFLWRKGSVRVVRWYLTVLLLGYFVVTTPLGARALVAGLSDGYPRLEAADAAQGADTVVVLGGGSDTVRIGDAVVARPTRPSLLRALEGARVFKLIGARLAIVLGGMPRPERQLVPESQVLCDVLVAAGVPASAIVQEASSKTTRDQARLIGPMLAANNVSRFVLVTSPTHMRRSVAVFRAAGLDPIPSVAPVRADNAPATPLLLPNDEALALADEAVYDYAATVYYWLRGWTRGR